VQLKTSANDQPPRLKHFKLLAQKTRRQVALPATTGIEPELEQHTGETTNVSSHLDNLLNFWAERNHSYPVLAPLAEDSGQKP